MKKKTTVKSFGKRLAEVRKAKGITQVQLGKAIGVSQRVIAYYEGESEYPPAHLLLPIAKKLKVSLDELMGVKKSETLSTEHAALWRKLKKAEQLSKPDQKMLTKMLDALLSKNKLKRSA